MTQGRKKKPKTLKLLEGDRSKVGKANIPDEPQGLGRPRVPLHLAADERKLCADIVASLPVGLLTRADEATLERMAVAWARYRSATLQIRRSGLLIKTRYGKVRNPLLVVQNVAAKEMHAAGSELGLSPVARARMTTAGLENDDPMALLLGMDDDPAGAWSTVSKTRN